MSIGWPTDLTDNYWTGNYLALSNFLEAITSNTLSIWVWELAKNKNLNITVCHINQRPVCTNKNILARIWVSFTYWAILFVSYFVGAWNYHTDVYGCFTGLSLL